MTFLRVIGFSIALLLFYMGIAHMLPQVIPDTSEPVEVSTDSLDMDGMIALGESIFKGKGTCTLCHNGMGRAPDILVLDMGKVFSERLADPQYKGVAAGKEGAKAVEEYIHESMIEPSAYVVSGFGKKGTNDTESPMPTVNKPPIELSAVEMNAVTAFLQDLAGLEPTVPLPSAEDTPVTEAAKDGGGDVAAPLLTSAEDIIDEYGCAACHDLNGSGADLGPSLNGIGKRMDRAKVIEAVIDPNATIAEGYEPDIMPGDFGEQLRGSELLLLADYLLALPEKVANPDDSEEEPLATTAADAIDKFGCAGCHDLEGSGADVGPKLNGIGKRMTADEVKTAITDPNDTIAQGFDADIMPDDFADQMDESELGLIVDYLMNLPE